MRGPAEEIAAVMSKAQHKRHKTQPHGYPNAGSIFKNPPGMYAGRLIESAGLKGQVQGRAQVSEQHANFIVNTGGASATDVRLLDGSNPTNGMGKKQYMVGTGSSTCGGLVGSEFGLTTDT